MAILDTSAKNKYQYIFIQKQTPSSHPARQFYVTLTVCLKS